MSDDQVRRKPTDQPGPIRLIVTVDTEEEGLWSGEYRSKATVENIQGVPRFQELCDSLGVRPTYLVTTPVAESDTAVEILRGIQDSGRCEIGTHVHPWNSPPLSGEVSTGQQSYLCNLDPGLQRAKITGLTDLIAEQFGRRPISFRAGRYGMGSEGLRILRDLGYRVDSSVIPFTSYATQGGPDFSDANCSPYFPCLDQILRADSENRQLLEVPVTVGFTHPHFEIAQRLRSFAFKTPLRQCKVVGILDRLGIATKVKLSPEQADLERMKRLTRAMNRRGAKTLVLMFHSSSLLPGLSPYVRDQGDLDRFLARIQGIVEFCRMELGAVMLPLGEYMAPPQD